MDAKLKRLDEFNGKLKEYDANLKTLEDWLSVGRKRMDDLIKPDGPIKAEDRVVQTMELQTDVKLETEKRDELANVWNDLQPTESGENTKDAQVRFLFGATGWK